MDTNLNFLYLSKNLHAACVTYSLDRSHVALSEALELISKELSNKRDARQRLGEEPETWLDLAKLWQSISQHSDGNQEQWAACVSLARLTRNLVADVAANQIRAFDYEHYIRGLLHHFTTWSAIQDSNSYPATRVLTQTLANIVTQNPTLISKLWSLYMALPEDQVVLIRLLTSPDQRTILAALVLILNCIHGSTERTRVLCTSQIGARLCISLLDNMVKLYDAEDATDGARAFDIGYEIFTRIAEAGLVPVLFTRLAMEDEVITPHQTTLLKLLDSYLQTLHSPPSRASLQEQTRISREGLAPMLSQSFLTLSAFAQQAIQRVLTPSAVKISGKHARVPSSSAATDKRVTPEATEVSSSAWFEGSSESSDSEEFHTARGSQKATPPLPKMGDFDILLPSVCEALVLITQCIVSLTLEVSSSAAAMKHHFNDARTSDGQGLIENLTELLRLLDEFLPRVNFGKSVPGKAPHTAAVAESVREIPGFSYLKRDLVRLLGILCHEAKAVQDRLRVCGGIPVLMNLCVVDERNPYLREHAIFTLHNLLKNNQENQAMLDAIRPAESWDENGTMTEKI